MIEVLQSCRARVSPGQPIALSRTPHRRHCELAITQFGGPIAHHRRHITRVRDPITGIGRLDTTLSAVLALLCAAIANLTRGIMDSRVAAVYKIAIAGRLIAVGRRLLPNRRGLIAVRPLPVSIRERLIAGSQRLIIRKRLGSAG